MAPLCSWRDLPRRYLSALLIVTPGATLNGSTFSETLRLHIAGRPRPSLLYRSSKVICDSTTGTQRHQSQCLEGGLPQDKNKEESYSYVYPL